MRPLLATLALGCSAPATLAPMPDATRDGEAIWDARAACPPHMAHVSTFCIDRYEGALEELTADGWVAASPYQTVGNRTVRATAAVGLVPQGYVSGAQAKAACEAAGKRLCSTAEWLAACRGTANTVWPYGAAHVAGACNDAYPGHPAVAYFGTSNGIWDSAHLNDPGINQQPGTVARGGDHAGCVTTDGVFDMHGNLHEWTDDPAGTFRGGFYADASKNGDGCLYVTTAHAFTYHDYSTGFRCCADAL